MMKAGGNEGWPMKSTACRCTRAHRHFQRVLIAPVRPPYTRISAAHRYIALAVTLFFSPSSPVAVVEEHLKGDDCHAFLRDLVLQFLDLALKRKKTTTTSGKQETHQHHATPLHERDRGYTYRRARQKTAGGTGCPRQPQPWCIGSDKNKYVDARLRRVCPMVRKKKIFFGEVSSCLTRYHTPKAAAQQHVPALSLTHHAVLACLLWRHAYRISSKWHEDRPGSVWLLYRRANVLYADQQNVNEV